MIGPGGSRLAGAPIGLGRQGLGEVGYVLDHVEDELVVLGVHDVDRVAQHDHDLGVGRELLDLFRRGRRIEVPRARLASALTGLRALEQAQVVGLAHPAVATRQVVAEVERLLVKRHEDLRMPAELLVEGGAAALERADDEEIGSGHARRRITQGPPEPDRVAPWARAASILA